MLRIFITLKIESAKKPKKPWTMTAGRLGRIRGSVKKKRENIVLYFVVKTEAVSHAGIILVHEEQ